MNVTLLSLSRELVARAALSWERKLGGKMIIDCYLSESVVLHLKGGKNRTVQVTV